MPFVTQFGSKQYIVDYDQKFAVDRVLDAEEGEIIEVPVLLCFGESSKIQKIQAKVLSHTKGKKIRVVKFRSKSNYHRQYGFRAHLTILQIIGGNLSKPTTESKVIPGKIENSTNNKETKKVTEKI